MAEFTKLLVTDRGSELVMKALQGKGIIRFTRLAASSRQYQEEDIKGLTSLEDIRQQGDISEIEAESSSSIRLRVALPNIDLTEGYYIRTVGLYANDPDEGEILYGVSMETSAGGCYVPAYNHQIVSSLYFHISVAVGNAENVSLEVDAGALVTRKQLDAVQQRITDEVKVLQEGMEEKADGTAFDNYKSATDTLLGNADITGIGDGTVTGAIRELNTGIVLSYVDGQYFAQYGEDTATKKVLGEISKEQLIAVLANSGLGLTLDSTPEEIYAALKRAFPASILTALQVSGNANNSPNILYSWYGAMYNLTGIRSITFRIEYHYTDLYSENGGGKYYYNVYEALVGVGMSKTTFNASGKYAYGANTYDSTKTGTTEIKISVSSLTGSYYIGVGVRGYNCYNGIDPLQYSSVQSYYAKILEVIFN